MVNKIKYFLIPLYLYGCFNQIKSIHAVPNLSKKLRMDGYYYLIEKDGDRYIASIYFFYQNGIMYYQDSREYLIESDILNQLDSQNIEYQKIIKRRGGEQGYYGKWGLYYLIGDSILIRRQGFGPGKRMFEMMGEVINSTSFHISKLREMFTFKSKNYSENTYYYFKQSDAKPDSTNHFFK